MPTRVDDLRRLEPRARRAGGRAPARSRGHRRAATARRCLCPRPSDRSARAACFHDPGTNSRTSCPGGRDLGHQDRSRQRAAREQQDPEQRQGRGNRAVRTWGRTDAWAGRGRIPYRARSQRFRQRLHALPRPTHPAAVAWPFPNLHGDSLARVRALQDTARAHPRSLEYNDPVRSPVSRRCPCPCAASRFPCPFACSPAAPATPAALLAQPVLSEIRIDQPSTDNDEYFELAGSPAASPRQLHLRRDRRRHGRQRCHRGRRRSRGQSLGASGYFVAAEATFTSRHSRPHHQPQLREQRQRHPSAGGRLQREQW